MKLSEALAILNCSPIEPTFRREVFLACGFTPLHLKTFLAAHMRRYFPTDEIDVKTGLYGDVTDCLERLRPSPGSTVCIVLEWADLDKRLGCRSLGACRPRDIPNIVESVQRQCERLTRVVKEVAETAPIYLCTPTLPLPPIFTTQLTQAHHSACQLREMVASLATALSTCRRTKLVDLQWLDEVSPLGTRFDPKAEVSTGFPYGLEHASKLAEAVAILVRALPPKKGIITDLDDTLWAGIVGEIGPHRISWSLPGTGQLHGLYQRFLDSLADTGVLLAIVSKNNPDVVADALARRDILVTREKFFPLEINWGPKSISVRRILERWNVAEDDVIFIDDNPMEVAEVQLSFPNMECIVFPKGDPATLWGMLKQLRDRFGKSVISIEDQIRLNSIRTATVVKDSVQSAGSTADDFLRSVDAVISFSLKPHIDDIRALELINKTNQFNLNGKRFNESEWLEVLHGPTAFMLTATYGDKYGPLGKIAVAVGRAIDSKLYVDAWVMSCRAFSRRIEHQCLMYLFRKTQVNEIIFDYRSTSRNEPVRMFFSELLGEPPQQGLSITKAMFDARVPNLFQRVLEVENE